MPNETCGNPLLQQWVKEWMEQAEKMNSKAYYNYKKAYDSLTKCPVVYQHPCEAQTLIGIGDVLVARLEKKMMEYCKENGLPMPERPRKGKKKNGTTEEEEMEDTTTPIRKRTQRAYIPKYRTGGYAILLALLQFHDMGRENVSKDQICRIGQDYCDASFTMAEGGNKSYTAWNSVTNLEKNGYVYKNGRPAKYSLTETGVELARRFKDAANGNTLDSPSGSSSTPRPSSFDVEDIQPLRNPSAARGRKKKSTTSDLMDRFLEQYDTGSNDRLDLSLYVSNPSEHQSISINGRTSTGASSSNNNERSSTDILQALADASRPAKRKRSSYANGGYKKQRQSKPKSRTAALMDSFLANYDDSNGDLNMSNYVMNPQDYQSISLGDRTVHNKPKTTPSASTSTSGSASSPSIRSFARPTQSSLNRSNGTSSSVTNSSTSSFARSVMNADDDDTFDWGSTYSSAPKKYSTPSTSTILQADKNKRAAKTSKPAYNVDEYSIDLSPPLLPTFKNSTQSQSNDVVDLLSSPESSPVLQASEPQLDDDITFDDNFDLEEDYFPMSQSITKQVKDDTFHYTYLDVDENDVRSVAQAAITVDEKNGGLAYRVRCYTSQSDHPKFKCLILVMKDKTHIGCSIGYLPELQMDPVCPGLPARPVLALHREEADDFWPRDKFSNSQTSIRNDYNERLFSSTSSQSKTTPTATQRRSTQPSLSQTTDTDTLPRPSQKAPVDYSQLVESTQLDCMLPHEYEIILVLDSREIQMQKDRDYFRRKIAEKGVNIVTRSLDLGDVIWVARKKGSTNPADEVFLDYIIERKRLDDLVTSIKDGRFVEQKTRLKRSGAEKVIYLVEEYNPQDVINFGVQAVQTAMSSTQIIDGFFLKRTNNIEESIEYIVSITKLIHTIYKNTTLYTIPSDIITRQNYLDLKEAYKAKANHKKDAYLVSYSMFSALNTKNGCTSLHEIYLRMIMTVKGVNAERALSLIQVYPTPHSLLTAFKGKSVEEAKNLLRDATQHHISRRKWGTAISERLYTIWGALEYPPPGEDGNDS